jgi:hypothetical protein
MRKSILIFKGTVSTHPSFLQMLVDTVALIQFYYTSLRKSKLRTSLHCVLMRHKNLLSTFIRHSMKVHMFNANILTTEGSRHRSVGSLRTGRRRALSLIPGSQHLFSSLRPRQFCGPHGLLYKYRGLFPRGKTGWK